MTLQQIRYLMAVVEWGSISEAAKRLYVAQSSISSAVKDIESRYEITIFQRSSKGVVLTREGEELLVDLERILDQMKFIEEKYKEKNHKNQRFCISTQHHICSSDALLKLLPFIKNTDFRVGFLECKTQEILENVEKGISDIGIIFYTVKSKNIMIQELRKKDLIFNHIIYKKPHIYVRKGHPLSEKNSVHSREIEEYPFVTYDQIINNSSIFTDTIVRYDKIKQFIYVTDRAAAYSILRSMDAFVVGSGYHSADEKYSDIATIPIHDADNIEIGWISKSKFALSDIAEKYIQFLMELA
jgi:DNA-binding transcriptional LysR family regulator